MVIAFLVYVLVLYLNLNAHYKRAIIILLINGNFQIASVSYMLGSDAGIHLFLVAAAMSPFLYFSFHQLKYIFSFSVISLLLFVFLEVSFQSVVPLIPISPGLAKFCYISTFVSNLSAVVFFTYYLYRANFNAEVELEAERERAERLLLNILPVSVAERLKRGEQNIADHYDEVSILFADIVDFTTLSSRLSATELVELLDLIFTYFDTVVERFQLEKMRTIGDGYYVASGVPVCRSDHAHALVKLAIEFSRFDELIELPPDVNIEIRMGIHSGSVIAGVIGVKKFQYDLWGDTVNTASRMESHGESGRIHISETTYNLINDQFKCLPRGGVDVKGKGIMNTWFVEQPK